MNASRGHDATEFFVPIFSAHLVLKANTKWFFVARVEKELGPIKLNRQACMLDVGTQIYLSSRIKSQLRFKHAQRNELKRLRRFSDSV